MSHGIKYKKIKGLWQEIAKEAQEYRDASIDSIQPNITGLPSRLPKMVLSIPATILSPSEIKITEMPPDELVRKLADGHVTAKAATIAFLRRAAVAQKLTNCITELLPERALSRAEFLDKFYLEQKRPIGPLHGLPISVKEHLGMKDLRLSAGYCAWWNKIAVDDAHILKILYNAGAIFYARTTEPQSIMHLETDSNLYGVTVNPYNPDLSAGGSSGGEGALISLRGSCLGIGTDVGGSIRSPAANNGVYGFKPTGLRLPTDGWSSIGAGADCVVSCVGPLSSSITGLNLFMRVVLSAKPWLSEPALIPLPWNPPIITARDPLKIGIMAHDNVVLPHPPITRAISTLSSKLSSIPNITIVTWRPHLHDEAWAILSSLYYPDGGKADRAVMAETGEPWLPLTEWIIKENPCVKKLTMEELWYWLEEREEYRREYATIWNNTSSVTNLSNAESEHAVDVIICPVGPGVAPRHNTAKYWGYTAVWNLLDYPAAVFPVDKVNKEVDVAYTRHDFMSGSDEEEWKLYDPEVFHGLPISLQMVGRRSEDEKVLAILEYIHKEVKLPFVDFP